MRPWSRWSAVIGAYFAADGLAGQRLHGGFSCSALCLETRNPSASKWEAAKEKLDEYVVTTAFIMRLFFSSAGAQVDFGLIGQYWLGGGAVVAVLMLVARPARFSCAQLRTVARDGVSTRCCSCADP